MPITLALVACLFAAPNASRRPAPELITIDRDYDAAIAEYFNKDQPNGADTPHPSVTFAPRIRKFVEAHRGTPDAVDAIRMLLRMTNQYQTQGRMNPDAQWAVQLLTDEYAAAPEIIDALVYSSPPTVQVPRSMSIALYEKVLSSNTDPEARAMAQYCLATTLIDVSAAGPRNLAPAADRERDLALWALQGLSSTSPATRGGRAAAEYLADRALSNPGALAPDFEATDLTGQTIRLSQLRGRVVILVFWGLAASADGTRIPVPADLTARFKEKPVTFLGICADENPAKTRATLEREAVTWPNIADGATGGKIAALYHIRRWSSIFVIDQEGKIATRDPDPKKYEKTIDALLNTQNR